MQSVAFGRVLVSKLFEIDAVCPNNLMLLEKLPNTSVEEKAQRGFVTSISCSRIGQQVSQNFQALFSELQT